MKTSNIIKTFKIFKNPLIFYSQYLGLGSEKVILQLNNGLKYYSRKSLGDQFVINEIFFHQEYHKGLERLDKNNSIVFDIGAHIGSFSLLASQHAKKVYAFEPIPVHFIALNDNINLNHIKNITPKKIAIASNNGKRKIKLSSSNQQGSFYLHEQSNNSIVVKTRTLKDQIKKNKIKSIDLIKLDCEGSEFEIINSLDKKTFSIINAFIFEYHDTKGHHHEDLTNKLIKHDFKVQELTKIKKNTGIVYAFKK